MNYSYTVIVFLGALGGIVSTEIYTEFKVPDLPYSYNALEPYIDKETMRLHRDKHHAKYVSELNAALKKYPKYANYSVEELVTDWQLLPKDIRKKVRDNAGGHFNHSLFWRWMTPNSKKVPSGRVAKAINDTFGSFDAFKKQFDEAARKVFGSGWAWLVLDDTNKLNIITTPNQNNPLTEGSDPLLGLDVWEHAYYLKYKNERPEYITAWWNVVDWDEVSRLYDRYNPEDTQEKSTDKEISASSVVSAKSV